MKLQPQTIMVAIQSVEAEIRLLDKQLESDDVENAAELEQVLVSYDLAAADLKAFYEAMLDQYSELPSYDTLINAVN
ncbi:MAG: hypothetical protein L3J75_14770 [Methylococcaceae bacterium]|nr:hypothetical protein [Methylococcaceae bacterium]